MFIYVSRLVNINEIDILGMINLLGESGDVMLQVYMKIIIRYLLCKYIAPYAL